MSNAGEKIFTVEGHGQSILSVHGGGMNRASVYRRDPLLTRKQAWECAKMLMATGQYHTIKVIARGENVFRACLLADGTYMNIANGAVLA